MYEHAKNKLHSFIHSFIHSEIRVPCPFLTTTTQKLLKLFSTLQNLHQHAKYISSVHPFILVIQQVLVSHNLKGVTPSFDHAHQIIISFPEFVSPFKKSIYSINSFMKYNQFKSPATRVATLIFDHIHPSIFLSTLNFRYQYAKKQAISSLFHHNPAI